MKSLLAVDLFWIAMGLWLISTADQTIEICYLFNLIFEVISAYGTVGLSLTCVVVCCQSCLPLASAAQTLRTLSQLHRCASRLTIYHA